jgi:RHS repeat-associated protein
MGRRVQTWDGQNGYVNYAYSGLDIVYENNTQGAVTKHYYAIGLQVAENRGGAVEYFHEDALGSTRLKTNSTGGVIFKSNYLPFGQTVNSTGTEDFKYTGKHEDASGLYYFAARYYDPTLGRFTTQDPERGKLTDPQTMNLYVYCRNNPLKYTDPDGRWINIAIGALVGAFIGGLSYYASTGFTDWQGALVHAGIGAVAGGIAGATFGAVALYMAPTATIPAAVTMDSAIASLGSSAVNVVIASAISSVVGGFSERCAQNIAYGLGAPGVSEKPAEPWDVRYACADFIGGVAGGFASFGVGKLVERFSSRIVGLNWMAKLDVISESPRGAAEYYSYLIGKNIVSKTVRTATKDAVKPITDQIIDKLLP